MKIDYDVPHAMERMAERNVGPVDVETTLEDPDIEYSTRGQGKANLVRVKNIGGRDIKVYFSMLGNDHVKVWTVAVRGE